MKIVLLTVGATAHPALSSLIAEYEKRINRFVSFECFTVPTASMAGRDPARQKEQEGRAILAQLQPSDCAILLDERGKTFRSQELAQWINKLMVTGYKRLVWIVGGPYGFSQEVYQAVQHRCSLSALTFPHDLVHLIATEQLYRAFTILHNHPYHHD